MSNPLAQRRCCLCAREEHKCVNCQCSRQNRKCTHCRKGDGCRNPRGRSPQGSEREEERPGDSQEPQQDEEQQQEADPPPPPIPPPPPPPHTPPRPRQDLDEIENVNGRRNFIWKGLTEEATAMWVNNTYNEIVGWSTYNLFEPPKCSATTKIVKEMVVLLHSYIQDAPLAPFVLKIFFLLPKLFFQKTHRNSKTGENVNGVTRRVDLWQNNKLDELLDEARAIQKKHQRPSSNNQRQEDKARIFADRMRQGKVSSELRALDKEQSGGVLPLTREIIHLLKEKHPPPSDADELRLPSIV